MNSAIRYENGNLFAENIGDEGLTDKHMQTLEKPVARAFLELKSRRARRNPDHWLTWMDLPTDQAEVVARIKASWAECGAGITDFVVLGIGGSALGNICLNAALHHPFHNVIDAKERQGRPRVWVVDNIDPVRLEGLMQVLPLETTLFNVITKSGSTAETMGQFYYFYAKLVEKLKDKAVRHVVAVTDQSKGVLRKIADDEKFDTFVVPDGVGGRFSVMSPVGLYAAHASGIDIDGLLAGALAMDKRCDSDDLWKNPALFNAAVLYHFMTWAGKNIHVMMSYSDRLYYVADWYRQLWAESLGKKVNKRGRVVHTGQTPVKALGVTDQHSQVQLYAEGPFDKVFTFLTTETFPEVKIPAEPKPGLSSDYLGGVAFGDLFTAERIGTQVALSDAGRPNQTIVVPEITAHTVGQLLYGFMLQTAYVGELLGIDTYDQPGVEAGKIATYALMGRKGYEAERKRIKSKVKPQKRYTL
ncbi:MAG: glucose-6-phosphate isomerase [Planctomycetota bacterium]